MSLKIKKVIDGVEYLVETFAVPPVDGYARFGIQLWPRAKNISPESFSLRVSEEFIEDEIDNKKDPRYLESVVMEMLDKHLEEMLSRERDWILHQINYWLREAKCEIDRQNADKKGDSFERGKGSV